MYFIIAVFVTAADQLFKKWIVASVPLSGYMAMIPGIIHLTYVRNTGAAFSIFTNMRLFLTILTSCMIAGLIVFLIKARLSKLEKIALSAVLGGAVGNLIDRVFLGYVVDMFEVEFIEYAVFNVADSFIVVGGIVFCICYLIDAVKDEKAKKAAENSYDDNN